MFGDPSDGKIRPVQALHDAGKAREVLDALTPQFIATLRGTDLRQAYVLMGDDLQRLGRPDEALGQYQLGVSLFPKNVDLLTRQAALLHASGLDEQARPLFDRALKIEPRHWGAHQGLAEIDRRYGFLDRSAAHYEVALDGVDSSADIWRDYAQVLLDLREYKTADLALRKSLALEPKSPEARVLLAFARRAQGDPLGAADDLEEAAGLGAGIGARRAKALFLLEAGKDAEADAEADAVLRTAPGDAAALWVKARASLTRGNLDAAAKDLGAVASADGRDGFGLTAARALGSELRRLKARREEENHRR
ncbi:MAG: tetratricopeptide repeat protein [Elusimicrobia bacterium]|nr:tetratricopeptide repeat protein [Elusimicrobiota bacterium]